MVASLLTNKITKIHWNVVLSYVPVAVITPTAEDQKEQAQGDLDIIFRIHGTNNKQHDATDEYKLNGLSDSNFLSSTEFGFEFDFEPFSLVRVRVIAIHNSNPNLNSRRTQKVRVRQIEIRRAVTFCYCQCQSPRFRFLVIVLNFSVSINGLRTTLN